MDGTDDVLWSGRERMGILRVSGRGNLKSYCEEDEGTDSVDGDSDTDW